jgi:transcriptional regulator with XRE-family HTH domain
MSQNANPVHVGRNIQKIRLIRGFSQSSFAQKLEDVRHKPVSQQLVSDIENRSTIEDEEMLKQIAKILGVDTEMLTTLDLSDAIQIIGATLHDDSSVIKNYKNVVNHNAPDDFVQLVEKTIRENETLKEKLKQYEK